MDTAGGGREPAYNEADRHSALNVDASYRSRWSVNTSFDRRHDVGGLLGLAPATVRTPIVEDPVDLEPLVRLAQETRWARLFNRPRHSAIADA